jgi:hypothetical protein
MRVEEYASRGGASRGGASRGGASRGGASRGGASARVEETRREGEKGKRKGDTTTTITNTECTHCEVIETGREWYWWGWC